MVDLIELGFLDESMEEITWKKRTTQEEVSNTRKNKQHEKKRAKKEVMQWAIVYLCAHLIQNLQCDFTIFNGIHAFKTKFDKVQL